MQIRLLILPILMVILFAVLYMLSSGILQSVVHWLGHKTVRPILIVLGILVIGDIAFMGWATTDCYSSEPPSVDAKIPFGLLSIAIALATFVPTLVHSLALNLLSSVRKYDQLEEGDKEHLSDLVAYSYLIDFFVNQATLLVLLAVILVANIIVVTNVRSTMLVKWIHIPLFVFYIWYIFAATTWSRARLTMFIKTEKDENGTSVDDVDKAFKNIHVYYIWIFCYFAVSMFLLSCYRKYSFANDCLSQAYFVLKFLIVVTSIWLFSFATMWIIPSDELMPLNVIRGLFRRKYPKT